MTALIASKTMRKPLAISRRRIDAEVEKLLHQFGIVGNGVDDDDFHAGHVLKLPSRVEIDVGDVDDLVAVDHLCAGDRSRR